VQNLRFDELAAAKSSVCIEWWELLGARDLHGGRMGDLVRKTRDGGSEARKGRGIGDLGSGKEKERRLYRLRVWLEAAAEDCAAP